MSTVFTWKIAALQCYPQEAGHTDVVTSATWSCQGVETVNGVEYKATSSGTSNFQLDPSAPFIPYADLTQDQVLAWVWATGGGQAFMEQSVQYQLDTQSNNPVVSPPLPWATPAA